MTLLATPRLTKRARHQMVDVFGCENHRGHTRFMMSFRRRGRKEDINNDLGKPTRAPTVRPAAMEGTDPVRAKPITPPTEVRAERT